MERHGTRTQYQYGCRCIPCRKASSTYYRVRRAELMLLNGQEPSWRRSGAEARRVIRRLLDHGWTQAQVARTAEVSPMVVSRLVRTERPTVLASTHRRITEIAR